MTASLTFCPTKHEYRIGDRVLPSVTQVLTEAGLINPSWYSPEAAERGTVVHECCAILNRGLVLDWDTVDDRVWPYVDAYRCFLGEMGDRLHISEVEYRVMNANYGYAGTTDILGKWDGRPMVCDIKTGDPEPWHALQLAGYSEAYPIVRPERYCIYLNSDGKYGLKHYTDPSDRTAFLSAVALVNWKRRFMR